MQNNDFDFMKYFNNFIMLETKESMIKKYIAGKITKQQLDEFMEGQHVEKD